MSDVHVKRPQDVNRELRTGKTSVTCQKNICSLVHANMATEHPTSSDLFCSSTFCCRTFSMASRHCMERIWSSLCKEMAQERDLRRARSKGSVAGLPLPVRAKHHTQTHTYKHKHTLKYKNQHTGCRET
jgi:hypothetical protein